MDDFTENGIHKPTAEAFYLVLSMFTDVDVERVMSAVDVAGALYTNHEKPWGDPYGGPGGTGL